MASGSCAPHQQVEHMAAPTEAQCSASRKPLPTGSRPHMAQSGHLPTATKCPLSNRFGHRGSGLSPSFARPGRSLCPRPGVTGSSQPIVRRASLGSWCPSFVRKLLTGRDAFAEAGCAKVLGRWCWRLTTTASRLPSHVASREGLTPPPTCHPGQGGSRKGMRPLRQRNGSHERQPSSVKPMKGFHDYAP